MTVVRPFECGTVCLPQDNGFETLPLLTVRHPFALRKPARAVSQGERT
jgi:hypothetical protein